MDKAETLDEDWERIVQNSEKHGVVLFSMGSVANTSGMPWEYKVGLGCLVSTHARYTGWPTYLSGVSFACNFFVSCPIILKL